jgi:hypothetical protein
MITEVELTAALDICATCTINIFIWDKWIHFMKYTNINDHNY